MKPSIVLAILTAMAGVVGFAWYFGEHETRDRIYIESRIRADGSTIVATVAPKLRHASNQTRYNLACDLHEKGRHAEAEREFLAIVSATPDEVNAWNNLGTLYYEQRRYEEAKRAYRTAIEHDPNLVEPRGGLGTIALQEGRYEEALEIYSAALRIAPSSATEHYSRGVTYGHLGRYELAQADLRKAIELAPKGDVLARTAQEQIEEINVRMRKSRS